MKPTTAIAMIRADMSLEDKIKLIEGARQNESIIRQKDIPNENAPEPPKENVEVNTPPPADDNSIDLGDIAGSTTDDTIDHSMEFNDDDNDDDGDAGGDDDDSGDDEGSGEAFVNNIPFDERQCRFCKCTEYDCSECVKKTGERCHWVAENVCSACADELKKEQHDAKDAKQVLGPNDKIIPPDDRAEIASHTKTLSAPRETVRESKLNEIKDEELWCTEILQMLDKITVIADKLPDEKTGKDITIMTSACVQRIQAVKDFVKKAEIRSAD
jgi:hypothetical protein